MIPNLRTAAFAAAAALILTHSGWAQDLDEGIRLYQQGAYEEARQQLEAIVAADPGQGVARGYLGLALVELGQYNDAEPLLAAVSGDEAPRDRVLVGLARVRMERRDPDGAVAALNEAQAVNEGNPDVFFYRGLVHSSRQNYRASADDFERTLQLDPGRAMAHYYAGLAYNGLRQRDRMVEHFQTFLRLAPNAPEATRVRALLRSL